MAQYYNYHYYVIIHYSFDLIYQTILMKTAIFKNFNLYIFLLEQ